MQNGPAGSAGSHPVAGVPASVNPNCSHSSNGIGPADAGALSSALMARVKVNLRSDIGLNSLREGIEHPSFRRN
jgi:hypothetical protein